MTNPRAYTVLAQAKLAVGVSFPRVVHAMAKANPDDHAGSIKQLRDAQAHVRELLTRLEIAELELAAQPLAAAGKLGGEEAA